MQIAILQCISLFMGWLHNNRPFAALCFAFWIMKKRNIKLPLCLWMTIMVMYSFWLTNISIISDRLPNAFRETQTKSQIINKNKNGAKFPFSPQKMWSSFWRRYKYISRTDAWNDNHFESIVIIDCEQASRRYHSTLGWELKAKSIFARPLSILSLSLVRFHISLLKLEYFVSFGRFYCSHMIFTTIPTAFHIELHNPLLSFQYYSRLDLLL